MNDQDHQPENLPDHLKELSAELKQQFTHIEQEPPNKPSFLLVVLLSGVAIIIIFILAIVILHLDGNRFGRHSFRKHPTSQLVLPSAPASARSALA
jgi:hypothetical protein